MIKKLTLTTLATMALLFIPAQAEGMKCQAGKCGAGMTENAQPKVDTDCKDGDNCKAEKQGETCKKGKKSMGSPLLLPLPSAMRWIEKHKENTTLALTAEQKTKLEAQHDKMMPEMMKLKKEIATLAKKIKVKCKKDVTLDEIQKDVEKLATLKTQTTMMKMTCLRGIKGTVSKEQWKTLKALQGVSKGKVKSMKKEMKCQAGKCGANGAK